MINGPSETDPLIVNNPEVTKEVDKDTSTRIKGELKRSRVFFFHYNEIEMC